MTDSLIGKTLGGRYILIEKIKEGGMAMVYKARDTNLDRFVAVKLILPQRELTERFLVRFKREAKSHARLSHPNIVTVFDYGEFDNKPYIVMEYIPDGTLKALLGKPLLWQEAAQFIAPVANALAMAHAQGIIHRDVKPSNILMSGRRDPRLSDFGIAKLIEGDEETADLTGTGIVGTYKYMAPEQGVGKSDERSDIYSLGVVFYQLVTGKLPFDADSDMAVMLKKNTEPLPPPRQYVPNLPLAVENVLIKALARDPSNRFKSMREFSAALGKLFLNADVPGMLAELFTEETTTDTLGNMGRTNGAKKKGTVAWILSGGTVLICIVALLAGVFLFGKILSGTGAAEDSPPTTNTSPGATEPPFSSPTLASSFDPPSPIEPTSTSVTTGLSLPSPPEPTPTLVPSNGNLIAFNSRMAGNADIYIVGIDGTGLTQLTTSTAHDLYPSWSPDGTQIVYQTNEGGDQELVIINVSNKKYYAITNNTCNDWGPVWSPVGNWIAFYSDCDGERNIYKIRVNGNDRTQLTFNSGSNSWFPA